MEKIKLKIENMHCASCIQKIEKKICAQNGVKKFSVNFALEQALIVFDPSTFSPQIAVTIISDLGYPTTIAPVYKQETKKSSRGFFFLKVRALVAIFLSLPLVIPMVLHFFGSQQQLPLILQLVLASIVQFGTGYSFYIDAWKSLKNKMSNMDVLVVFGTSAAYFYSVCVVFFHVSPYVYFETSSTLIALVLLGRLIEKYSKDKAISGVRGLLKLQPQSALLIEGSSIKDVPLDRLNVKDTVIVRPGQKIPIDGTVIEGISYVDESLLTGESLPVKKVYKSKAFAGTVNGEGTLKVLVEKVGEATSLGNIIKLVEQAQSKKAPIQKLVDTVSNIFVPVIIFIGLLTFSIYFFVLKDVKEALLSAISVFVIACPCALGLSTPIVVTVALGRGAKAGVLVKDIGGLEKVRCLDTFILDKTGTVTEGQLSVEKVEPNSEDIIEKMLSFSTLSDHPISTAITRYGKEKGLFPDKKITQLTSHPGMGISASYKGKNYYLGSVPFLKSRGLDTSKFEKHLSSSKGTVVALGENNTCLGLVFLSDRVRAGATETVKGLQALGKKVYLLSGDRKKNVAFVTKQIGADGFFSDVMPDEKAQVIKSFQKDGKKVGMVGDGINDAPALATANVGFAIGSGVDIAMESATIGLMHSHLTCLLEAITLSKRTYSKIRQNLFFAFFYNIAGIPLAAFGLLNPMIAGAAMAFSSISVVLNALTLKKR